MKYLEVNLNTSDMNKNEKGKMILELEEKINTDNTNVTISELQADANKNDLAIYITKNNVDVKSLKDFANEGKIIKEYGLKYNLFTENNYISFFKIVEAKEEKKEVSVADLDKMIVKVDDNDEKVLDVLNKLNKLKKD